MKLNKNAWFIVLSAASLIGGIWTLVSAIRERKDTSIQVVTPQIKIDPGKIGISIEGKDLTKPYPGSDKVIAPVQVLISIDTKSGSIYVNGSKMSFGALSDSLFEICGHPDRFKTLVSNSTTYIFDRLGFYIRSDSGSRINALSVYYKAGVLDISPRSVYSANIVVDGIEISGKSIAEDLITKLNLGPHPMAKHNYIKLDSPLILLLNFDSPDKELVNVFVEAR